MGEVTVTDTELAEGIGLEAGEWHKLVVLPHVVKIALLGAYFDTNRNFILPKGIKRLTAIGHVYRRYPNAKLLIVGHTDTVGTPEYNDTLSVERAESMAAYLQDKVDIWVQRYDAAVPASKRWGAREDEAMVRHLRARASKDGQAPTTPQSADDRVPSHEPTAQTATVTTLESMMREFQSANGLKVDGIAGPLTRTELIKQYMAEDGTTLPATIEVTTHGCGEYFPLDPTGALATAAPDETEDALDRRVELFFFNGKDGIRPPPPGKNSKKASKEYPEWRTLAKPKGEWIVGLLGAGAARCHTRFSPGCSFPKPSMLPTLHRLMEFLYEDAQLNLEIVGHTDESGNKDDNVTLSKRRAESTGYWLTQNVDAFRKRFDGDTPGRQWGWEEVQWMLLGISSGGAPTYVSQVDGCAGPETHLALALFQSTRELPVNGLADDATLKCLITEYLALAGVALGAERVFVEGAGSRHSLVTFGNMQEPLVGDGSVQQLRRVDFFVTEGRMSPPASELATSEDGYETWCKQVKVDLSLPNVFDTYVAVVDEHSMPLVGVPVTITEPAEDGSEGPGVGEGTPDEKGTFVVQLPRGFYGAYAQVNGEILRGTLAIDPDVYGAQRIALVPEPKPMDLREANEVEG